MSLSSLDLLQSVVGSIDYGSLLQWEKVSSVARRMRCLASNPNKTIFERTIRPCHPERNGVESKFCDARCESTEQAKPQGVAEAGSTKEL